MCSPIWETDIPSDMFSCTWETHIACVMCFPGMCSLTWEIHISSVMSFPMQETHIPR